MIPTAMHHHSDAGDPALMSRLQSLLLAAVCSCLAVIPAAAVAAESEAIAVAAIFSRTGQAAASNRTVLNGVQLAIDEINDHGGVLGRPLQLLVLDNQSTPIGSSVAARLAVDSGVSAIIGASWSSHSLAIAQIAQQYRIPMISPLSTVPKLTAVGDMIFRICFTDDFQGRMLARFVFHDLDSRSAKVFVDLTSDYSMELARVFSEHFRQLGGIIVREIEYKSNQLSYDQQLDAALSGHSDAVVLTGYEESGFIAAQLQDRGLQAAVIGGDGWGDGDFYALGGNRLKKAYFFTHWAREWDNPHSRRFVQSYGQKGPITFGTALGYDAVHVLAAAIVRAGSSDREKIRGALSGSILPGGVTGDIALDGQGDPIGKNIFVIEIENGIPSFLKTLSAQQ